MELPPLGAPVDELWEVLLELSERLEVQWTLIGGQMVLLHSLEHGTVPPQVSEDGDIIANIRTDRDALKAVVAVLRDLGFDLEGVSADGVAHRYVRARRTPDRPVVIDILAPEGLGERADLTTTGTGRTIQVPGGTQALDRTERIAVRAGGKLGMIPRPSLLGAVIAKSAACGLPEDVSRHLRDLALLCSLLDDPFETAEELTAKDRKRLRLAKALDDPGHPSWLLVPEDIRSDGRIAWAILNDLETA